MAKPSSDIPKELQDSMKRFLNRPGTHPQHRVKLETKSKKYEDRVLVLTTWRVYIFLLKVPAKVESSFNVLEIRSVSVLSKTQILVETEKQSYSLTLPSPESVDQFINYVNLALSKIFPSPASVCSIRLRTPDTPESTRNPSPSSETSTSSGHYVCGGFSETYAALCDYNGMCCREEVQWDVDTIYHSQDNREFNLLDFSHLEGRDLAVIVAALAYNQWFTKLYCKDLRLGSEVIEQVLHTVSKSSNLEELILENSGLRTDFAVKLSLVFAENPGTALHTINLSHNQLEDKGIHSLSQQLLYFPKGLKQLYLSKTSITSKGLVALCQTLGGNPVFSSTLLHLDLSKNPGLLSTDDANSLYTFLAQPNALLHLDLSGTDCAVDTLFGALLHGCCTHLTYLNLARNAFSHKKIKDALPSFKQFFSSAFSLNHINLSGIKLPMDALRALFQGLSSNTHISDVHLDLSGCELRSAGAQVLQEQFCAVSTVGSLDVSENGFDSDLITLIPALGKNKSLNHLFLGKNFNVKSKTLEDILQRLVQVIQEEDCSLQSLSIADSRLKSRTSVLINALGSNNCLTKVDISGNSMEDIGAKMLAKALQINSTLRTVLWDRNNTPAVGFLDVARALENNYSLKFMTFPISDITQAYRNNPKKTEEAWQKIQWSLLRNNHSQTFSQQQVFRLHQGIVTSAAEQMMDRLCVRVQEEVRALRSCPAESVQEDVLCARQFMKDAKNSRALFPSLYELGHIMSSDGPVRHRLESVASEVSKAVDKELQVTLESMVNLTQELCPYASRAVEGHSKMLNALSDRVTVPHSFIHGILLEQAGLDIQNKLNEVKMSVVTYLTNSIVDEVLQGLYNSHKKMSCHMVQLRKLAKQEEEMMSLPLEPALRDKRKENEDTTDDELSTSIGIDTIAIKRQLHCRKIRPVSAVISVSEQDLDLRALEVESPGWFSSSTSSQYSHSRSTSFEILVDLPTDGTKLEHQTRERPRPRRTTRRRSTKHSLRVPTVDSPRQENGTFTRLDEGLDEFFGKKVISESPSLVQPFSGAVVKSSPVDPPQQKKRHRLFHFRKHRTHKTERDSDSESRESRPEETPVSHTIGPEGEFPHQEPTLGTQEKTTRQDVPLTPPVVLPGMGGVKGLPSRTKHTHEEISSEENQEKSGGLVQPARIQGIALPGMGGARGWSLDSKKESVDVEETAGKRAREWRRSSEDMGQGTWKPQPPPQSLKPSFSISRRPDISWQIEEGCSCRDAQKEHSFRWNKGGQMNQGENVNQGTALDSGLRSIKSQEAGPILQALPAKPVPAPRGQKPSFGATLDDHQEEGKSCTDVDCDEEIKPTVPTAKPGWKGIEGASAGPIEEEDYDTTRRIAPLKPKRSRRAQSCNKLGSDRGLQAKLEDDAKDGRAQLQGTSERKVSQRSAHLPVSLRFMSVDRTPDTWDPHSPDPQSSA
ncbi:capping protein, Arp2/3 and myosin-I linker protein 3 isoform X2 [Microcaecilia unicolor]|uniref:Capping protein, Arp2/3 and myosin-I linker protein 3 isoform X2 n=1 Tax=Microcaecilia unicolor TaxID=1415580 RepID=A0A6P7WR40_9AMPH|nr:capping protein, Arp2/3 and myosin-I linker protein 3 isoform X2 [Microcaecilia unicolor]